MLRFMWFAFPILFYCPLIFLAVYFALMAAGVEKQKAKYIGIASALAPFQMLELILILALGQATDTQSVQRLDVQAEGTPPARPDGIAPVPEIDLGEVTDSFGRRRPKPQPDNVYPKPQRRTWGEWWRSKDRPVWGGFKNMLGGAFNGVAFYVGGPYFIVKILGGLLTLGFCAVGAWFVVNVLQLFKRNKE